jgi:hypothetical protein
MQPIFGRFAPRRFAFVPLFLTAFSAIPAFAQLDFTGVWRPQFHEDQPERIPGPELGDYAGLPITDQARHWADSWDASRVTLQEHQCQVHVVAYIYRGPLALRIWEEREPESQKLIAIHQYIQNYEQSRTIWMDGRPHPPDYALHTWMGFSTGKFDGVMLTVNTTHIKQGWIRRNGLPESDRATLVEHFIRYGNVMTHVSIVTDPVYLSEPLIKSQDFMLDTQFAGNWIYPCDYVEEITGRPADAVPNHLPGKNPFIYEWADKHDVPHIAARGGAETMYPEFRLKMNAAGTAK